MTEDGMVGWHNHLNGHEFEQTLGVGDGQGGLACCSPWGHKELDLATEATTQQLDNNEKQCNGNMQRCTVVHLLFCKAVWVLVCKFFEGTGRV